jgi:hypothetical protein
MKNDALVLIAKGNNFVNGFYCKDFGDLMHLGQSLIKKYNRVDQVHFLMNYGGSLCIENSVNKNEEPIIDKTFSNLILTSVVENYNPVYTYIFKDSLWYDGILELKTAIEYKALEELFLRYKNKVILNKEILSLKNLPEKCQYNHLLNLINEAYTNGMSYPTDKLHRWLGFIQGVLSVTGIIDVDVERDYTRPLLHAYQINKIKSF